MTLETTTTDEKRFTIKLQSFGNPDYGQYTPISEPMMFIGETLGQCREAAMQYIAEWDLGGGNWSETRSPIRHKGQAVALVSYNGRVWTTERDWKQRKEISL